MNLFFRSKISVFLVFLVFTPKVFASSANEIIDQAIQKSKDSDNLSQVIYFVEQSVSSVTEDSDVRALYTFLGQLNEQVGLFKEACNWYAKAAGIPGVPTKEALTSEQLVLAAIRSALSGGDYETAESYLTSIRGSKNQETFAFVRLYTAWAYLSRAETQDDLLEPIALLKSYATMPQMKIVQPAVYLTLWYVTGEASWKSKLLAEFPKAPETAVTSGKAEILPSPFWFFLPQTETYDLGQTLEEAQSEVEEKTVVASTDTTETTQGKHKIICQQLGFFRNKENASRLMERVRQARFLPELKEEVRASGTTYFVVIVPEDDSGNTGLKLKTAGFECYPVFAE